MQRAERASAAHDLQRTKKQIENNDPALARSRKRTLPDLRVQATYLTSGLADGTAPPRGSPAPLSDSNSPRSATCSAAVRGELSHVDGGLHAQLFRSPQRGSVRVVRSELEARAASPAPSAELKVVREVRQAAMQNGTEPAAYRDDAAGPQRSEQRLDVREQKRFEVGMSTNFNVIQAQRDLAIARKPTARAA